MGDTMTAKEVAAYLRCHVNTVYARINDRSRPDAFPLSAIDKGLHGVRIHRSALPQPVKQPTPIRPVDLAHGQRDAGEDRIAALIGKVRALQIENLELSTELIKARQELDLLRMERGVA